MPEKFHFYMDETGQFEGCIPEDKRQSSFFTGLIVPETEVASLSKTFLSIVEEAQFTGFIHATDLTRQKKFTTEIADKFVKTIKKSKAIPFKVQYEDDVYSDIPEQLRDSYAVNRYLNMAQAAIEHFLFLCPDFFGRDLVFDLHPNSRVLKIEKKDKKLLDDFHAMGFHSIPLPKHSAIAPDQWLTFTWGDDALRSYLHRMATEYIPFQAVVGKRCWDKVETIVAKKSSDPFVAWVDILTWLSRPVVEQEKTYKRFKNAHESLVRHMKTVVIYGLENQQYRELIRHYLAHDMSTFFSGALQALSAFSSEYYKKNIQSLLSASLNDLTTISFDDIVKLESQVNSFLRNSQGNWQFVLQLTDYVIRAIESIRVPKEEKTLQQFKLMYIRLLGHKISVFNHRGNTSAAWRTYEEIKVVKYRPTSVDQFRGWLELENRMAVACANNFSFEKSNEILTPSIEALEQSLVPLSTLAKYSLSDSQLGKLRGTRGQNYAFLASRTNEYFALAEDSFISAAKEFSNSDDRMRHAVNRLHLYLDWRKTDLASACLKIICADDSAFGAFLNKPSSSNARYMQFGLSALLKFKLYNTATTEYGELVEKFSLAKLQDWFGEADNEHPFEFICSYLGRMAYANSNFEVAREFFDHALNIPRSTSHDEEVTLQVIRAQILCRQAIAEQNEAGNIASANMLRVIDILKAVGSTGGLELMLKIVGDDVSGWFAQGWLALKEIDWRSDFSKDACQVFFDCFTFNYH